MTPRPHSLDTPEDTAWADFGRIVRVLVASGVIISTALYAGRLLEKIDRLGMEIQQLSGAVADLKVTNATVQSLVQNQQSLAAVDNDLRHQIEDLRVAVARLERLRGEEGHIRP